MEIEDVGPEFGIDRSGEIVFRDKFHVGLAAAVTACK
jgi:hypothetical protein